MRLALVSIALAACGAKTAPTKADTLVVITTADGDDTLIYWPRIDRHASRVAPAWPASR